MTSTMPIVLACLLACAHGSGAAQAEPGMCKLDSLVSSINDFSFDLTEKIGGLDNFFMSALSIFAALGMTYMGSGGNTAAQMQDALKLTRNGLQGREFHEKFSALMDMLANVNGYQLSVANGMFAQQGYALKQPFVHDAWQYYKADVKNVNFAGKAAVKEINKWVARRTNNTIKSLFDKLGSDTRLVILNAIYFNEQWKYRFDEINTRNETFYKNDNTEKMVPMMTKKRESFLYYSDMETKYDFLKLPYRGEDVAMLLALPRGRMAPANLRMTPDILCRVNSNLQMKNLERLAIPKFRLENTMQLVPHLSVLGMQDLFQPGLADLTGISEREELYVSHVIHKAFIKVDEKGTEASGASGVVMLPITYPFFRPSFIADHPFSFYIVHERNGLVLFSGRVADP